MDILRAGGTFWTISRRMRTAHANPVPWMPELAGGADAPDTILGHRPIVVTCNGVVMHVEPARGHRETGRRIKELAEALYALPWAAGTADDPSRSDRDPRLWAEARNTWEMHGYGLGGLGGVPPAF